MKEVYKTGELTEVFDRIKAENLTKVSFHTKLETFEDYIIFSNADNTKYLALIKG